MYTKELSLTTSDDIRISAVFETPDQHKALPTVVLLHGFGTSKDNTTNKIIAPQLHDHNIATLRFDYRGHGKSGGQIELVNSSTGLKDLEAITIWAKSSSMIDQKKIAILGGSYGGNTAVLALERSDMFVCGVLKVPAVDFAASRRWQIGEAQMKKWESTGFHDFHGVKTPFSFYKDTSSYDAFKNASKIKCPVLIVAGDRDEQVPVEQSIRLADELGPRANLLILPNADHGFSSTDQFEQYTDAATKFLQLHLK